MRIAFLTLIAVGVLFVSPLRAAEDAPAGPVKNLPYAALNRALTEKFTLPAYAALVPAMQNLAQASAEFCQDPVHGAYPRLLDAFGAAMNAWQHVQGIVFGPIVTDGRAQRVEFWPDTGAATDRAIRRVMNDRDPAMVAENGLTGKSVALQSLAMFERLLAENAARLVDAGVVTKEEDLYACAWMTEIGRFQTRLATNVAEEWANEYAKIVLGADAGNATYADARAAATDYLKSLSGIIDVVIVQKLERPMDASVAKARASRAESWRTKRSMANIVINLEAARALMAIPDGFADLLAKAGSEALAKGMIGQFDKAIATAKDIGKLEDALGDTLLRPKLEDLLRQLRAIRVLIQGPLSTDTELVVGFNALDGDGG